MRVFCLYQLGILPYCILRNVLYAMGQSKRCLFLEILKTFFSLSAVVIGMQMNPFAIALLLTLASWLTTFAYGVEIHKSLHFDLREIFGDLTRIILCCIGMSVAIQFVDRLISKIVLKILLDVLAGILVYILLSMLSNSKYFVESLSIVNKVIKRLHREN